MRAGAGKYKFRIETVRYKFRAGAIKHKVGPELGARAKAGGQETQITFMIKHFVNFVNDKKLLSIFDCVLNTFLKSH